MYTIFLQSQAKYNHKHRKTLEKSARNRILLPSVHLLPRNPIKPLTLRYAAIQGVMGTFTLPRNAPAKSPRVPTSVLRLSVAGLRVSSICYSSTQ